MRQRTRARVFLDCLRQRRPTRARSLATGLALASMLACAEPSVPWTPDAATRHRLAWLADEAGLQLPLTQWPLPSAAVAQALDELPATLPPALEQARTQVRRALEAQTTSRLAIALRGRDEALTGFGDESMPGPSIAVRSGVLGGTHAVLQLGARVDERSDTTHGAKARLDESALATERWGIQFQAWAHRSWWGPGWQSSLPLSNNPPPPIGFGIQRPDAVISSSPWLRWMGPWNGEFFVARTEGGQHAYLYGARITLKPFSALEIGLTRTAQWGGRGRPQSIRSFINLVTATGVNADTPAQFAADPGNGMAGFDLRGRCPGWRCAAYGQFIGEDEAGKMPSKYLALYGLEGWTADGRHRGFVEFAETMCGALRHRSVERGCAYRNGAYPEGYTSDGRWMGANVGPDSRLLTLGWLDAQSLTSVRLHAGRVGARVGRFSPTTDDPDFSGRLRGLSLRKDLGWHGGEFSAQLDWMHVRATAGARTHTRLGLSWRTALEERGR